MRITSGVSGGLAVLAWMSLSLPCASVANETAAEQAPRSEQCFDFDWRFQLGETPGAESPDFDDRAWRQLDVPHDWSAEQPFDPQLASGTGYLPGGIGWYRKTFFVPESWRGKEVSLLFDGISRNAQVWINGHKRGGRPNGYLPIGAKLTGRLKYGEQNVVAVRVAREEVADSRWYPGTGIYRHAWLTVTNPVSVHRWGVFVTTPRVTDERADLNVAVSVRNELTESAKVKIETVVLNPAGQVQSRQASMVTSAPQQSTTVAHWHVQPKPQRWSTESPELYTMQTRVYQADELVDETRTKFGIRTFHYDPNKGFFLNHQPITLKGLCTHHDAGVVGAAVPDDVLYRRLRLAKEMGCNAIRCSHNPMAAELYDFCDQLGLLVMDEAFDEWELGKRKWVQGRNVGRAQRHGYNQHFEAWGERDAADMVRRSRNHPSIVMWSIGNEIDYPGDPYAHPEFFNPDAPPVDEGSPSATRLPVVAPALIAAVKRHDATRPVTMALSNIPAANSIGLASLLDVAGYNYQERFYEQDHQDFPGRIIYGSENGRHPGSWRPVEEHDFVGGLFLWVGFDFLGEAGRWPNRGSQAGVFDARGFLKPESTFWQAVWSEKPFVTLLVAPTREGGRRGWLARHPRVWKGESGRSYRLRIAANCDEVRVTLNGRELPVSNSRRRGWSTESFEFEPGELVAVGYRDGQEVARDRLVTPGIPNRLELVADKAQLLANGQQVSHVEVRVLDAEGNLVGDAAQEITVSVTGAGRLLGVENGDQNDTTPLNSPTKRTTDGRLLALVQAAREPGEVKVTAQAEGLQPAEFAIAVGP